MSSLQASAPASTDKSYDPEIKDMADYIHHYKVDSDLAVCAPRLPMSVFCQSMNINQSINTDN